MNSSAYGLNGAPFVWHMAAGDVLSGQLKLKVSIFEQGFYMKFNKEAQLILVANLHVDNCKAAGAPAELAWLYEELQDRFGKVAVQEFHANLFHD